jgi:DNA polymerase I
MNAPMQGNGAEMMRLAAIAGVRSGVQIDSVLHDAFMVESDRNQLEDTIAAMQAAMAMASNKVLGGLELKTDVKRVYWPDRYMDSRPAAKAMWNLVTSILPQVEQEGPYIDVSRPARAA